MTSCLSETLASSHPSRSVSLVMREQSSSLPSKSTFIVPKKQFQQEVEVEGGRDVRQLRFRPVGARKFSDRSWEEPDTPPRRPLAAQLQRCCQHHHLRLLLRSTSAAPESCFLLLLRGHKVNLRSVGAADVEPHRVLPVLRFQYQILLLSSASSLFPPISTYAFLSPLVLLKGSYLSPICSLPPLPAPAPAPAPSPSPSPAPAPAPTFPSPSYRRRSDL